MTEPKKTHRNHPTGDSRRPSEVFEASVEGLNLAVQRKPQPGDGSLEMAVEVQPPEPALVSKLINFIKKI